MKIAIFGQFYHHTSAESIATLCNFLEKKKIEIYVEKEFYSLLKLNNVILKNFKSFKTYKKLPKINKTYNKIGTNVPSRWDICP